MLQQCPSPHPLHHPYFFFLLFCSLEKKMFWPACLPWTYFSDVWLTIHNRSALVGGPWAINSQTQPNSKDEGKWIQTSQAYHPACSPAPQGHMLLAWPACLSAAADLSQSYICLSLHHPCLLCWHFTSTKGWCPQCVSICMWVQGLVERSQWLHRLSLVYISLKGELWSTWFSRSQHCVRAEDKLQII